MVEESSVRIGRESRGIVGHAIEVAWDEIMGGHVAIMARMESLKTQEVSRRAGRGRRAFAIPIHGRGIVVQSANGGFGDIYSVGHDVVMTHSGGQFEITVRNLAGQVAP